MSSAPDCRPAHAVVPAYACLAVGDGHGLRAAHRHQPGDHAAAATRRAPSTTWPGSRRSSATLVRRLSAPDSPSEPSTSDVPLTPRGTPACRAAPVFLIPLIGYGALYMQPLGGAGRFVPRAADRADDRRRARRADASARGAGRRAAARRRADAAARGGHRADRRSDPDHARGRRLRACQRRVRPRPRLLAARALAAWGFRDLVERGFGDARRAHRTRGASSAASGAARSLRRRRDGSTFPAACTVVRAPGLGGGDHPLRRRRARHHPGAASCAISWSTASGCRRSASSSPASRTRSTTRCRRSSARWSCCSRNGRTPAHAATSRLVRREAARAGQIVRNLLRSCAASAPDRVTADLNDIVRSVVELRGYHLQQRNITLRDRAAAPAAPCSSTAKRSSRSSSTCVLNAEQAMQSARRGQRHHRPHAFRTTASTSSKSPTTGPGSARSARAHLRAVLHDEGRRARAPGWACRFRTASRRRMAER